MRQHLPGEREMYIEATFGGLEVTLGDEHGDILSADITGMCMYDTLHAYGYECIYMLCMKEPGSYILIRPYNVDIFTIRMYMLMKFHEQHRY